jgi:hypothetical protein
MALDQDADAIARGDILPDEPTESEDSSTPPEADAQTPSAPPSAPPSEGEEDVSADPSADKDSEPKEPRIPKSRFDQAVQKERERAAQYERELQKYREREQQQAAAANFEESQKQVKELLKQHSNLLADGDLEKASDVMEQVLQLRDDMAQARAQQLAENTRNSTKNEMRYDATVERIEAEYPEINPDADEFDQTAVRRVQMMMTGVMQNEGKDPATALQESVDILLKPLREARGQDLRAKPSEEAVESGLRRTQQQIDKNVRASNQQPPAGDALGKDHDRVGGPLDASAVKSMSFEDFLKVPDSELAKIRGDFIE